MPWGGKLATLNFFQDITERRQAREALSKSEQRYRNVYDTAPLAFVIWDLNCCVTDWNCRAEEVFGWSGEDILGKNFFEFLVPESARPRVQDVVNALLRGEIQTDIVNENITKNGEIRICQWNNSILYDNTGRISGVMSLGLDITEKRRLEIDLLRAQKLETVGIMAGGLAHDFNNLLTPILANISMANMYGNLEPDIAEHDSIAEFLLERFDTEQRLYSPRIEADRSFPDENTIGECRGYYADNHCKNADHHQHFHKREPGFAVRRRPFAEHSIG